MGGEQLGIVPQEGFLFAGTVRENISFGRPGATDEEIAAGDAWPRGYVHIPRGGVTPEWLQQLTAEQVVRRRQGTQDERRSGVPW